jgi:hypothetical protein
VIHKIPIIFIVRNIIADQLQLIDRLSDFNNNNKCQMNCKIISHINNIESVNLLDNHGILVSLCNQTQLEKIVGILKIYKGEYNLCIDEVDFSLKSKDFTSKIDNVLNQLKQGATHILGATATPMALFSSDKYLSKIKKLKPNVNYCGIESLNLKYVNPYITKNPKSDISSIYEIYSNLLNKNNCVLLHMVSKNKHFHSELLYYLSELFPTFTILTYNGTGIKLICKTKVPLAKKKSVNKYGQLINKYFFIDNVHYFINYSISEVLQILKDHNHSHISIISGNLASRGISFVSSDYSLHLTDQYFVPGKNTHGENYLQSLRILGCYNDNIPLTLWCSIKTWKYIVEHNNIIYNLIKNVDNKTKWFEELQKVNIPKPGTPITRPKLLKGTGFNKIPLSNNFTFEIKYQEEDFI